MMMMLLDRTTTERKGRRSAPLLFRTFSLNPDNNTTFEKKTQLSPGLPAQRRGRHHQRRRHHPEQDDRHAARGQDARRARPLAGRGGGRRHDLRDCESLSFSSFFFFLSAFCAHFRPFF